MVPQPSLQHGPVASFTEEQKLRARVEAEFAEMPGLRLTLCQAARLFCIERGQCERLLRALVDAGVLVSDGRTFALTTSGRRCA